MSELIVAGVSADDAEAKLAVARRCASGEFKKLKVDFALIQGFDSKTGIETGIFYARSSPGASANLHAERMAIKALCESVGAEFYQNEGEMTAKKLREKNITLFPKFFTELPPCPACQKWLEAFASVEIADVVVKFAEELEDYFKLDSKYQQDKLFDKYIKEVTADC